MSAMIERSGLKVAVGLVAFLGLWSFGCAGTETANAVPDNGNNPPAACTQPGLYLVSPQSVTVPANGTTELQVRYACDEDPYAGALVSFTILGDSKGSALSAASAQTDGSGVASVSLVAGATSVQFQVQASADGASPLTFDVRVNAANAGSIVAAMSYGGQIVYNEFKAYLFQGRDCATLDPFSLPTALQQAPSVPVVSSTSRFDDVPTGSGYAVAVTAKRQGELLGFGCAGTLGVVAGQETDVTVAIYDIPITFSGTYALDNHFDMSGLLPPTVGNIVHIFDEMSDDHAVEGNLALDQWGVDPAAFLLDFVYSQFCKWECTNSSPTWDNCTPGTHPTGDLKATYRGLQGLTPFMSWSGDQPRFMFLCGMLDPTWGLTQWMQNQVQAQIPTRVVNILDTIGDISRAIDKAHIESKLTLTDVRPGRQGNFTHELQTMVVDLHDLNGTLHTVDVDLAAAGVGTVSYSGNISTDDDDLHIPSHTFALKFGKLVQYIYLDYLLPLLGCAPPNNTTACLFAQVVDCQSVGQWLHDSCDSVADSLSGGVLSCPITATQFAGFCTTGLQVAGNYIDVKMDDWIGGETQFSLEGQAQADQLDSHRVATSLKNGVWAGSWSDGTNTHNFPGSFTGVRQ